MGVKKGEGNDGADDVGDGKAAGSTGFSDEELEGLSAEERAALEEGDDDKTSLAAIAGGGEDEADDDGDDDGDGADKGAAAADDSDKTGGKDSQQADGEDKGDADGKAAAGDGEKKPSATADDADPPFVARYNATPPENYDQQIKDLGAAKEAATTAYKNNEISIEDLLKKHDEIDGKRRELEGQKLKAEMAAEQNEQNAAAHWEWEINRFMRTTAKNEGIDYRVFKDCPEINKTLNAELDAQVKILGSMPANADRDGEWFLAEAHKRVKAIHGLGATANDKGAPKVDDKGGDGKAKAGEKAGEKRRQAAPPPKTLGNVPTAGESDASGGGEFAHLDKLDGIDLENAVARMTPEQQERYARA